MTEIPYAERPLFRPGPKSLNWLIPLGMGAVGWALYMRYMVVEPTLVALACEAGLETTGCYTRAAVLSLSLWNVFGAVALVVAAIQLWSPGLATFAVGLVFAAFALVFHNEVAGAFATMGLILSFARPGPATP